VPVTLRGMGVCCSMEASNPASLGQLLYGRLVSSIETVMVKYGRREPEGSDTGSGWDEVKA